MSQSRTRWTEERKVELEFHWNTGKKRKEIARLMGVTENSILGQSHRQNLHYKGGNGRALASDHEAVVNGRSLFPGQVREVDDCVLKPGAWQRKLGSVVEKGKWKGFPIYSLTLEERATCPRTCAVWSSCYGNGMHRAARYQHGPELERELRRELRNLQRSHPNGFVVRLHILGDFMSLSYVRFWERMLNEFSALHVFGYTAWLQSTRIGQAIADLRSRRWMRFAVRTSGAVAGPRTVVVAKEWPTLKAIVCPAQTGKTKSCSTCGLCWSLAARDKAIAFLRH